MRYLQASWAATEQEDREGLQGFGCGRAAAGRRLGWTPGSGGRPAAIRAPRRPRPPHPGARAGHGHRRLERCPRLPHCSHCLFRLLLFICTSIVLSPKPPHDQPRDFTSSLRERDRDRERERAREGARGWGGGWKREKERGTGAHTNTRARTPHTNTPDTDTHTQSAKGEPPHPVSRVLRGPPPAAAHPASEERLTRAGKVREPQRFNFVARPAVEVPVAGSPPRRPAPAGEAAQHQGGGAGVCSSPGRGLGPAAGEAAGGAATPPPGRRGLRSAGPGQLYLGCC